MSRSRSWSMSAKDKRRRKAALARRDGADCYWCGAIAGGRTLDHVVPASAGGSNRLDNLVLSCETCNNKRGGIHGEGAWPHLVGEPSRAPSRDGAPE